MKLQYLFIIKIFITQVLERSFGCLELEKCSDLNTTNSLHTYIHRTRSGIDSKDDERCLYKQVRKGDPIIDYLNEVRDKVVKLDRNYVIDPNQTIGISKNYQPSKINKLVRVKITVIQI